MPDFFPKQIYLGLKEFSVEHTSENIAKVVLNTVKQFGIAKKLGTFTLDNASNNDTAVQHLIQLLKEEFNLMLKEEEVQLRCLAHILHIIMKTLLLYGGAAKEAQLVKDYGDTVIEEDKEATNDLDANVVSQLSDVIEFIHSSDCRKMKYLQLTQEDPETSSIIIPCANLTRWVSL